MPTKMWDFPWVKTSLPMKDFKMTCFFFFTSYSLSLPEKAKDTFSLCIHFPFICVLAGFLAFFFPLLSHIHSPCCAYETWLISVRNLPYITRVGAHSCKSHDQYVGTAIMKMDGRADRADRIPQAFPPITLISHSNKCLCGLYKRIFQFLVWFYLYF